MKCCFNLFLIFVILCLESSCGTKNKDSASTDSSISSTFINPLLPTGGEPWVMYHNNMYYYTHGCENKIIIWQTPDITNLREAKQKEVWIPSDSESSYHLWGPEIHRINNKWYIYFTADDGNMDNHHIYVIENSSENPFDGEFVMKGRIKTDANDSWAIHANVFEHKGELYMTWSGWQKKRIDTENQCIYIARMENPWTLSSDRVLISKPEYEWERQWVNPDGSKTAYPIYVNEAPQFFESKNKDKVLIYYSASGNWTPYYCVGLLSADSSADLLKPTSWKKSEEPVFRQNPKNNTYSPGNLSFIPSPDGKDWYFVYHAREIENEPSGAVDSRSPRMQKLQWGKDGMPVFGEAVAINIETEKPSGFEMNN